MGSRSTLEVSASVDLLTLLVTFTDDGFGTWTAPSNNASVLSLPVSAAVVIDGGELDTSNPCNHNKAIKIGGIVYSNCNGSKADYSFEDLNNDGGSIYVAPTSNSPTCEGETLELFANPAGTGSTDPTNTFSWSGTGPGGYTFSSTSQDPTISGILSGTYNFEVTITHNSTYTNTNSVEVVVNSSPTAPTVTSPVTYCIGDTAVPLTATGTSLYSLYSVTIGKMIVSTSSFKTRTSIPLALNLSNAGDNFNIANEDLPAK